MMDPPDVQNWPLRRQLWTVPNLLCYLRIVGLGPLLWAAWNGHRQLTFWVLVVLLSSDWLDGKLARWLDQRTVFGARLDSVADAVLYVATSVAFWWLESDAIRHLWPWFLAVLATWTLSAVVGLLRFRKLPSYHTRAAKICWLAVSIGALHWLATGDPLLVPWVLGLVVLTNLEAVAVGFLLPSWQADVPSFWHAWRIRRHPHSDISS